MNVEVSAIPGKQGVAFKYFVVIALVFLFALFLYAILGPLPNQSKFLKKSGISDSLAVNGTSLLNGDVVIGGNTAMNGIMNVVGVARAGTSLSTPELDLITTTGGVDTIQGKILGKTNGTTQIQGSSDVTVTDVSGTNTIAKFTGSNQQTDFYGNVILNNIGGNSVLSLKNQSSSNPSYELLNDTSSDDFILRSKNSSLVTKNILDATSNGSQINLLDSSSVTPFVYINGASGAGRVYDTVYNQPPSLNPTLSTLTVTGISTFNSKITANQNVDINGILDTKDNEAQMQGIQFFGPSSATIGGRIAVSGTTNLFVQGNNSVNISKNSNANFIASFDTSAGANVRSNATVPGLDLKGYMKYTLPSYISTGGVTYNSFSYVSSSVATGVTSDATGWPSATTQYIGAWASSQAGANAYIVNAPSSAIVNSGWQCPKRGIWQVTFDSNLNPFVAGSMVLSLAIGNISTIPPTPYGIDKVNTFAVIDEDDVIIVTPQSGSGNLSGVNPKMTFSLIMELNPATGI